MCNKPITIVTIMLHFTDFAQKYFSIYNVVINKIVSSERRFDDKNVFALELDAMEDVEHTVYEKGSRGHPGPKTHCLAAEKISDFIKSLN